MACRGLERNGLHSEARTGIALWRFFRVLFLGMNFLDTYLLLHGWRKRADRPCVGTIHECDDGWAKMRGIHGTARKAMHQGMSPSLAPFYTWSNLKVFTLSILILLQVGCCLLCDRQ